MHTVQLVQVVFGEMTAIPYEFVRQWAELYYLVFNQPPWSDRLPVERLVYGIWRDMIRVGAKAVLAVEGKTVVGAVLGYCVSRDDLQTISGTNQLEFLFQQAEQRVFYVDALCVHPDYQRRGIGESLLRRTLEEARGKYDVGYIILRTHAEANVAVHLFSKLGFQELGVSDGIYPDRIWMELRQ